MRHLLSITAALALTAAAQAAEHSRWLVTEGDHAGAEIIYARLASGAFRGEYIDPGFQEKCSVPIVGTIDAEGNVQGVGAILTDDEVHGNIYAKLTGKISGDTFEATWLPSPGVTSEFREMKMKRKEFSSEAAEAQAKHPDAFYNSLHPDLTLATQDNQPLRRAIPFKPAKNAIPKSYGYRIGENESRYLHIAPAEEKGEVTYSFRCEQGGMNDIEKNFSGSAPLKDNRFFADDGDSKYEVSIYNGFVVVKKKASTESSASTESTESKNSSIITGIYPAPMAMNFYTEEENTRDSAKTIKEKITKEILALPEMKFKKAAIRIESEPTDDEPYYTVRGGTDTEDHFATSHWFRVYTTPKFEIKYYDVVSDTEMTLEEYRGDTPDSPILTFHAYVKLAPEQPAEGIALLIDDVLMIRGDDKEKIKQFGIDPENVTNDYAIHNAKKEWRPGEIMPSGDAQVKPEFKIMTFDKEGSPKFRDASLTEFRKHLKGKDDAILAKVTASRNGPGYMVLAVKEQYVP